MRFFPHFRSKTAKNPAQTRQPDGTFGPSMTAEPRLTPVKQAENEVKVVSMGADLLTSINNLVKSQNDMINNAVEERLGVSEGPEIDEYSGLLSTITPIVQVLAPYIGPYVGPLLEKYAGVQPNTTIPPSPTPQPPGSESSAAPGANAIELITRAATTSPKLIKAGWPVIESELKKAGIEPETFKRAIQNLNKAI